VINIEHLLRSGHCAGGRGLFCGVCLYNRYGLDAREELKVSCVMFVGVLWIRIGSGFNGVPGSGFAIQIRIQEGKNDPQFWIKRR
jgi:hypothetical protein